MTQTKVEAPFVENNRPFRNKIINGDFNIFQRSTSAVTAGNNTYTTVDRWKTQISTDGAMTTEQESLSLADQATTGSQKAWEIKCTSTDGSIAANQYALFLQSIEGQYLQDFLYGTSSAKTLTCSFWVKSSLTGTYGFFAIKGDTTAYYLPIEFTISSANTWEKKVIEISPTAGSTSLITASGGVIDNDNGIGFDVGICLAMGSNYQGTNNTWTTSGHYTTSNQANFLSSTNNNFYVTSFQLEVGDAATDFEHLPHDVQLQRCQRYYQQIPHTASGSWQAYPLWGVNTNVMSTRLQLPVVMRAAPTGAFVGTRNTHFKAYYDGGYQTLTNEAATDTTDDAVRFDMYSSGAFAANGAGGLYIVSTGGRITLTAEL